MPRLLLGLLLGLAACSAAPTPAPPSGEPTAPLTAAPSAPTSEPLVPLEILEGGYRLQIPASWVSSVLSSTLLIAPDQALLNSSMPGLGLRLAIDATPRELVVAQYGEAAAADPAALFEISAGQAQASGFTIAPSSPITVNGASGLSAELSAAGVGGQLVVLVGPDQVIRLLAQSEANSWAERNQAEFAVLLNDLAVFAPIRPPTPTPLDAAAQPPIVRSGPEGFVLRLGGEGGPEGGRFESARGLAATADGRIFLAESRRGLWAFAPDGSLITTLGEGILLDAYDVALAPDGSLFVADYGRSEIVHLSQSGELLARWGSAGDGEDQFGFAAPQRIAVDRVGDVYALDSRITSEGRGVSSIMRFSASGQFIGRLPLPEGSAPADFAIDGAGNLYLAETIDGALVIVAPDGTVTSRIDAASFEGGIIAGAVDVDAFGFIYVATWDRGVLKLAPDGQLVAQVGSSISQGSVPAPGEFALPNAIALAGGNVVWVSDRSGEYSALTALRIEGGALAVATAEAVATEEAQPTAPPLELLVSRFASSATASSSYGEDYGPDGATGPPDVAGCTSSPNAWASSDPNGLETLELRYDQPLFAQSLRIYQSHQPGFVSDVTLIDEQGNTRSVYTATPSLSATCPLALEISFEPSLARIVAVRLTIDQRSGASWNEIDAVELIGLP